MVSCRAMAVPDTEDLAIYRRSNRGAGNSRHDADYNASLAVETTDPGYRRFAWAR
jgi:hypothetical protein